jgi:hypothetical protein
MFLVRWRMLPPQQHTCLRAFSILQICKPTSQEDYADFADNVP